MGPLSCYTTIQPQLHSSLSLLINIYVVLSSETVKKHNLTIRYFLWFLLVFPWENTWLEFKNTSLESLVEWS